MWHCSFKLDEKAELGQWLFTKAENSVQDVDMIYVFTNKHSWIVLSNRETIPVGFILQCCSLSNTQQLIFIEWIIRKLLDDHPSPLPPTQCLQFLQVCRFCCNFPPSRKERNVQLHCFQTPQLDYNLYITSQLGEPMVRILSPRAGSPGLLVNILSQSRESMVSILSQ